MEGLESAGKDWYRKFVELEIIQKMEGDEGEEGEEDVGIFRNGNETVIFVVGKVGIVKA